LQIHFHGAAANIAVQQNYWNNIPLKYREPYARNASSLPMRRHTSNKLQYNFAALFFF